MTEKRFDIIPFDANGNTVLIDRKGELIAVPLDFNIDGLTEEEKDRLQEWLVLLNENEQLKKENQRMTDKLNQLALEFLNYDMVTMGKATEMSEMSYYDFLKYRKENGNPMELKE